MKIKKGYRVEADIIWTNGEILKFNKLVNEKDLKKMKEEDRIIIKSIIQVFPSKASYDKLIKKRNGGKPHVKQ